MRAYFSCCSWILMSLSVLIMNGKFKQFGFIYTSIILKIYMHSNLMPKLFAKTISWFLHIMHYDDYVLIQTSACSDPSLKYLIEYSLKSAQFNLSKSWFWLWANEKWVYIFKINAGNALFLTLGLLSRKALITSFWELVSYKVVKPRYISFNWRVKIKKIVLKLVLQTLLYFIIFIFVVCHLPKLMRAI